MFLLSNKMVVYGINANYKEFYIWKNYKHFSEPLILKGYRVRAILVVMVMMQMAVMVVDWVEEVVPP